MATRLATHLQRHQQIECDPSHHPLLTSSHPSDLIPSPLLVGHALAQLLRDPTGGVCWAAVRLGSEAAGVCSVNPPRYMPVNHACLLSQPVLVNMTMKRQIN